MSGTQRIDRLLNAFAGAAELSSLVRDCREKAIEVKNQALRKGWAWLECDRLSGDRTTGRWVEDDLVW